MLKQFRIFIIEKMTQLYVKQNISQIFCQLTQLSHVQLEYSSTLFSYRTTSNILELFQENILKQISNRQEEMKHFSTDQGIGLRKILLQHYQRLFNIMSNECNILTKVTNDIYQKHKAMENSLTFVESIIKQMQHKSKVLDNQLSQVKQKIERLEQRKKSQTQSDINTQSSAKLKKCKAQSEIFKISNKIIQQLSLQKSNNSPPLSLFSERKFQKLETETQFQHVQSFLQLKMQQVEEYIRIEEQLTRKTITKIFEIFDETMGKGLQRLETLLLGYIQKKNIDLIQSIPQNQNVDEKDQSNSSSSPDLRCHENLQQILNNQIYNLKIHNVKKRLYKSSQVQEADTIKEDKNQNQCEELGTSPTFKYLYPLIIQSVQQIKQFSAQSQQNQQAPELNQNAEISNPNFYLFDSFCKENVNTMNR